MRKRRRNQGQAADDRELVSRELAWLDASSRAKPAVIFGAPVRCPTAGCGDFGLVEAIDAQRQHNRCWSCGTTWTLSRQALRLFAQASAAQAAPTGIVGAGTLVADLEPADAARTTRERFVGVRSVLHREPPAPAPPVRYLPNP